MKALILSLLVLTGCSCEDTTRANCFTCVARCHPFRVSACEPTWSRMQPMYCACDPFTRVDETPATIGPLKGGK
jgi:hypothetical protein